MALGDLNHDGAKDIALAHYGAGLVVLYNTSTLGISGFSTLNSQLFPNPVEDFLNIQSDMTAQPTQLQIINGIGQVVWEQKNGPEAHLKIDLNHLKSGIYFLKLTDKTQSFTQKFLKN